MLAADSSNADASVFAMMLCVMIDVLYRCYFVLLYLQMYIFPLYTQNEMVFFSRISVKCVLFLRIDMLILQ